MTQLGIGTATFSSGYGLGADAVAIDTAAGLLRDAFAAGIRYVDTAAGYGDAEAAVGRVANEALSCGVRVATKVVASADALLSEVRRSLRSLKLDAVDTLLLHSAGSSVLTNARLAAALDEIRAKGVAKLTGASTYGIGDASAALRNDWCNALQVEHSVLNPSVIRALAGKSFRAELIVRSVLCKGLLTSRRAYAHDLVSELGPTLDELGRLAAEWGWTIPEMAIRYALDTPGVDVVLVGISSEGELRTALSAWRRPPLEAEAFHMLASFDRSQLDVVHPERWGAVPHTI